MEMDIEEKDYEWLIGEQVLDYIMWIKEEKVIMNGERKNTSGLE